MLKIRPLYLFIFPMVFIFIYFYPGKIPSLFFYIPFFLILTSLIYGVILYFNITYIQSVDKKFITKGEKVIFRFSVHNEGFLIYPYVRVGFYGEDWIFHTLKQSITFGLNPFSHKTLEYELACKYRGDYLIGIKYIEIKDLLGFFSFYYYIREPREIRVYPRINYLLKFSINTSLVSDSDTIIKSNMEDMTSIADIRKYVYGDPLRKVHWKLSAKKNEWMVKKFDHTAQIFIVLLLDLRKNVYSNEENLILEDQIIEACVSVIDYCLRNWISIELIYYQDGLETIEGKNPLDFKIFYDFMQEVKFDQDIRLSDMMKMYSRNNMRKNNMILFTAGLEYDLYTQIYEAKIRGYDVTLIYISSEEIQGKKDEEEKILLGLKEIEVRVCVVQISDDIKQILEC